ncbi:unnamed protein product [Heterobilharzia americana]|nr:unnamed protein product [Heterobilharzia americana]
MCQHNQLIRNIIGLIGIISIFSHFIAATLWIAYILGWRIIQKLKHSTSNQKICNSSSLQTITMTTLTGNSVQSQRQKIPLTPKQKLTWPVCSLRMSTQLLIFSMEIVCILGCFTDLVRLIYLSITGDDLRLLFGDWLCRIQIFASFTTCDVAGWHFVCLCIERCYITLFPRTYYSMSHSSIRPAVLMIVLTYLIGFATNMFLLIPTQIVCSGFYDSPGVNSVKFLLTLIIPALTTTISTVIMISVLIKWKLKKLNSREPVSLYPNSLAINKIAKNSSIDVKTRTCASFASVHSSAAHPKGNNPVGGSRRGSVRLVVYNVSARVTVAKMMLICALLYLYTLLSLFVFGLVYSRYCCFLTASQNCNWNDNIFNLMSILHWTSLSMTSYVLMFGAVTIRQDIYTIVLLVWLNIIKKF